MSEDRAGIDPGEPDDLDQLDDDLGDDAEDDAEIGDESGDEPEGDEPEAATEPEPKPQRQPSRAERSVRALRARAKAQDEEIKRLRMVQETMLTQTRQPPTQPDPYRQAELDRKEAEDVALMAPHEVARYYAQKSESRVRQELANAQV